MFAISGCGGFEQNIEMFESSEEDDDGTGVPKVKKKKKKIPRTQPKINFGRKKRITKFYGKEVKPKWAGKGEDNNKNPEEPSDDYLLNLTKTMIETNKGDELEPYEEEVDYFEQKQKEREERRRRRRNM